MTNTQLFYNFYLGVLCATWIYNFYLGWFVSFLIEICCDLYASINIYIPDLQPLKPLKANNQGLIH
jgi:hypothetical protein